MPEIGERVQGLLEYTASVEGVVSLFGKVCLFIAVFLALRIGKIFDEASTRTMPTLAFEFTGEAPVSREKSPIETFSIITSRNIFGGTKENETTTSEIPQTKLSLRLVGSSVTEGGSPFAIIENTKGKEQDLFDLNENVFGQAKLIEILPESVKLDRGGTIEILLLEAGEGSSVTVDKGGVSASDDGSQYTISEEELNNELANLPRLLSQARAVPYFRNGASIGMRLFAIRSGSLYDKIGLSNGDILKEVNGSSLSDPSQALKLFEILKNERSISIVLERQGEDKTLEYSIQ